MLEGLEMDRETHEEWHLSSQHVEEDNLQRSK